LKYSSKERKISGIIVGAGDFNRVLISPNDTNTEKIMNDLIYLSISDLTLEFTLE
jgi:hypothetical protein